MKVLVVDDDVVARMMLMHLVDSCGSHAILEAEDGADAWRQLVEGAAPDIVFCDLRMPHLSGLELLQRVRAHGPTATLPFVLVSAAADGATLDEAHALGANGYIVKPFHREDVRAQFARLFPARGPVPEHVPAPAAEDGDGDGDEAPAAVVRRLGIDDARFALYLDGLARQLEAAEQDLPGLDGGAARSRLARLGDGCAVLGLHGAAAALARLAALPPAQPLDFGSLAAAFALANTAVTRQRARAAHG